MKCNIEDCEEEAVSSLILYLNFRGSNKGVVIRRGPYCANDLPIALAILMNERDDIIQLLISQAKDAGVKGDIDPITFRYEIREPDIDLELMTRIAATRAQAVLN